MCSDFRYAPLAPTMAYSVASEGKVANVGSAITFALVSGPQRGMRKQITIEVAARAEMPSTERGRILERFARRLLETQNFDVVEEVRVTGTEIDLLAVDRTTGERVFVECKAHRSNISAEVISKLLGTVKFRNVSAGWLISTYALSKDAKGMRDEWEQRAPAERRELQIYEPEALVKRLISAKGIVDPAEMLKPAGLRYADEICLLLTCHGEFWAVLALDDATGIRQSVLLFDATDGSRVNAEETIEAVSQTDTTLASLRWWVGQPTDQMREAERLHGELQSIVRVPIAEHWADYRPARPEDFVGRDQLQRDVFDFFDKTRSGQSSTRLLAIKAPSGWGKSSCVLKIGSRASKSVGRTKTFVFAVDSRAATTRRFGELALFTAIKKAIDAKFVDDPGEFSFGGADNPFSTEAMQIVLRSLRRDRKLICLFFDQFEELLYKDELVAVYDEIQALCNAVDEAQENVVIGFSWKTDGTIPPEHKAYHLWHSLADRRFEFELTPFTASEVTIALNSFSRELGQPLAPQLRRLLQDHCQGYPWLLKKLCIHIFDLIRTGMDQSDVLVRSLSIQELFKKDIERLSEPEYACVKQIAQESPAEFFKIVNTYGDEVVNRLLDKRLIVRSGPRLSIYWDIFRDYVLTDRIPYIPINYVPQANLATYLSAVRVLLRDREATYDALANELGLAKGTADNIVRDLVMVGHAEANRKAELVKTLHETEGEAARTMLDFCESHVFYRALLSDMGPNAEFREESTKGIARRVFSASSLSERLLEHYRQKLLRWFLSAGLVERSGRGYAIRLRPATTELLDIEGVASLRRGSNLFLADAPPARAVELLKAAMVGGASREELEERCGRNSFTAVMGLGLIHPSGNLALRPQRYSGDAGEDIRIVALQTPTVSFVLKLLESSPDIDGEGVGEAVADRFSCTWSIGSKRRYGSALRQWALWASGRGASSYVLRRLQRAPAAPVLEDLFDPHRT